MPYLTRGIAVPLTRTRAPRCMRGSSDRDEVAAARATLAAQAGDDTHRGEPERDQRSSNVSSRSQVSTAGGARAGAIGAIGGTDEASPRWGGWLR